MVEAPLLEVRGLSKNFALPAGARSRAATLRAVDGVDFSIARGKVTALVGESGSGKSTVAKLIARLIEPSAGSIAFDGIDVMALSKRELRGFRRRMQMIFQDPYSSLPPHMRVREILTDPLVIHGIGSSRADRDARVDILLERVGLSPAARDRFPHEFSGGQRQRIGIARALAVEPEFIIADEAVSALDVSIQAQIINVLMALTRQLGLTLLFISHNLAVVQNIADEIAVMYLGRIMEIAPTETLFAQPHHPYTAALLSAIPIPDPDVVRRRIILTGEIPSPINPPSGCPFRTRCPHAIELCARAVPPLRQVGPGHRSACLRDDLSGGA